MPDNDMKLIPVYALRDDGKSVTCIVQARDDDHAGNKMRWWMNHYFTNSRYPRDCNPDEFTFYIGEENYYAFLQARRELRKAG